MTGTDDEWLMTNKSEFLCEFNEHPFCATYEIGANFSNSMEANPHNF